MARSQLGLGPAGHCGLRAGLVGAGQEQVIVTHSVEEHGDARGAVLRPVGSVG